MQSCLAIHISRMVLKKKKIWQTVQHFFFSFFSVTPNYLYIFIFPALLRQQVADMGSNACNQVGRKLINLVI